MNTSLIKNIFFSFLLLLVSQVTYAQKNATDSKPLSNSLDYVTQLQPQIIELNKTDDLNSVAVTKYGFNTEDVQKVLPGAVKYEKRFYPAGKNNYRIKTVKVTDHQSIIPVLVGSIKEQQAEIDQLKKQLAAMQDK